MDKRTRTKERSIELLEMDKVPPQNIELEEVILGATMLEQDVSLELLRPEIFYKDAHQYIARAILNLYQRREPHDILLVCSELKKMDKLDVAGGPYYISQLTSKVASSANIQYHYRIVYQCYFARKMIAITTKYASKFFEYGIDVFTEINNLKDEINIYIEQMIDEPSEKITDSVKKSYASIMSIIQGDKKNYFKTGSPKFDEIISFSPGVFLMAGASGIGKTSFLCNTMYNLINNNDNIGIYWNCIDHDTSDVIVRKWMSRSLFLSDKQLTGKGYKLTASQQEEIMNLRMSMENYDIVFNEKPDYIANIGKKFEIFCKKRATNDLNVLVIDNVMRLRDHSLNKPQNEKDDLIANGIADIRKFTKNYNSMIIYLHHFNKEQTSQLNFNDGYRPTEDHLKGSSRLRDIAEVIILLNRPGNYDKLLSEYPDKKDILEKMFILEVTKNSLGPLGLIYQFCNIAYNVFIEI